MAIRLLVLLASLVPVVVLCVVSAIQSSDTFGSAKRSLQLADVVRLSKYNSAVIHNMQIERGRSVGMITGGYADNLKEGVAAQRVQVDAAVENLARFVADSGVLERVPELDQPMRDILARLDAREAFRAEVDRKAAKVPDVVGFYTARIDTLLGLIGVASVHSADVSTSRKLKAFMALVEAKEHGGLERALGGALFNLAANDAVTQPPFNLYWSRLTGERLALTRFRSTAPPEFVQWFDETVVGADVEQVTAWRAILADINVTQDGQGISGKAWFDTATRRLNLIKQVEDRIGQHAYDHALSNADALNFTAWRNLTMNLFAILLCLGLSVFAMRGFSSGMKMALAAIRRMATGDIRM
ncbi:MAG: nitrate- and nitrite sensing domain-containing protein, partial [Pseudomonadota bacterium]